MLAAGLLFLSPLPALAQALYTDHGDPTAAEQRVLEIINRARTNPAAEGVRLGIAGGITEGLTAGEAADVGPRPPLAMNVKLLQIARDHSEDMWTRTFFSHQNPDGDWPWDRADAVAYPWNMIGENIVMATAATAEELGDALMIDAGYPGRGHRKSLLDIDDTSTTYFREIGIGYYVGASAVSIPGRSGTYRDFLTENFGRTATGPFLVGVVYDDAGPNPFYDEGEGVSGVTITPNTGAFYAQTATAGGYAFPVGTSGSINVTATFAGWPGPIVKSVFLNGQNVKVDFRVIEATDTDGDGMPDFWEDLYGLDKNSNADATGDLDSDTHTNLTEFRFGSLPNSAASVPTNPGGAPPPPPPAADDDDDEDDSACGLTGLEATALLALLGLARRKASIH
jgi:hypothetical protein